MKLSLTQENLSRALSSVGRVVTGRASLPILSNVMLTTDGTRLRLSATNLEIGINYWVEGAVEREGVLTVPARLFAEFVTSLPRGDIKLEANDTTLTIAAKNYVSRLNGIAADEFPLIPEISTDPVLTVPVDSLKEALAQVSIAASADEARPVLAGIYLYTENDVLYVVATDSYRLAEKKLPLPAGSGELKVIVPLRTMQEVARLLGETTGNIEFYLNEGQIMFRLGDLELTSRLIEGQFPNYRQIIPQQVETSFDIATNEFSRITKVASLFARESAGSIKIEVKADGQVDIVSSDSEVGGNTSSAECTVMGDDGEISLNARYLQDALSVVKTPNVTFGISGKLNPCVIFPESGEDEPDYVHIVMPLRT